MGGVLNGLPLIDKAFGHKWTERKKKCFKSNVKTNQGINKRAGIKAGLLFFFRTPKANASQSYFAKIGQSKKSLAAALTRADESYQN